MASRHLYNCAAWLGLAWSGQEWQGEARFFYSTLIYQKVEFSTFQERTFQMDRIPTSAFPTISEAREFADQHDLMTDEQIAEVYREPNGRKLAAATVQRTRRIAEGKLRRVLRSFAADLQ